MSEAGGDLGDQAWLWLADLLADPATRDEVAITREARVDNGAPAPPTVYRCRHGEHEAVITAGTYPMASGSVQFDTGSNSARLYGRGSASTEYRPWYSLQVVDADGDVIAFAQRHELASLFDAVKRFHDLRATPARRRFAVMLQEQMTAPAADPPAPGDLGTPAARWLRQLVNDAQLHAKVGISRQLQMDNGSPGAPVVYECTYPGFTILVARGNYLDVSVASSGYGYRTGKASTETQHRTWFSIDVVDADGDVVAHEAGPSNRDLQDLFGVVRDRHEQRGTPARSLFTETVKRSREAKSAPDRELA